MKTALLDALQTRDSRTENGMVTNSSSLDFCVDLFFTIGAMRGQDKRRLLSNFSKAFNENPLTAMKTLFWARDVRGGAGERQIFRDIILYLAENHTNVLEKNLELISLYGRWDDLIVLFGTKLDDKVKAILAEALKAGNGLCAKWMPRKGKNAIILERYLKLSPKNYRKLLVANTTVVETAMCQKDWGVITYEHVPSLAMARYSKAFGKHDAARFEIFKTGDAKVNAAAVYPYDITKTLNYGDSALAVKQWDALPNYMEGSNERVLPVCDVSGSMSCSAGGNAKVTCMDVCISLGLYISERNVGPFQNAFFTFSDKPQLQYLNGNLKSRYAQLQHADWGGSTNLEATFQMLLKKAKEGNVSEADMPTAILIMSDMEFNSAVRGKGDSAMDMIRKMYTEAGYALPKVIFWNLQSRNAGNFPVQVGDNGTALVSGFSTAILKPLLSGEDMSPVGIMNKTVNSVRYEPVTV